MDDKKRVELLVAAMTRAFDLLGLIAQSNTPESAEDLKELIQQTHDVSERTLRAYPPTGEHGRTLRQHISERFDYLQNIIQGERPLEKYGETAVVDIKTTIAAHKSQLWKI